MAQIIQKLSFLLELFINGSFLLLYSLHSNKKIPNNWDEKFVGNSIEVLIYLVPFIIAMSVISNMFESKNIEDYIRKYSFSLLVFVPTILTWGDKQFTFLLAAAHLLSTVLGLYDDKSSKKESMSDYIQSTNVSNLLQRIKLSSAQLVLLTFLGVIVLGTSLLLLPLCAAPGKEISLIDAIFIATSATCVTGLSTLSISENFSIWGQLVILALIQVGGLSIMTLYSSMAILLGRSLRMKDRVIMQDLLDVSSLEELFAMIISIVKYTLIIELWGGIVLTIAFTFEGFEFGKAIYYGFFHSVSAFCNAGFALFDNSLENFVTNPLINGTIAVLITLGGLGFLVLKELREYLTRNKTLVRLKMHTKVVLVSSAILTTSGALIIFFGEFLGALDGYSLFEKIQISIFQSVTLRTAGFNTIPLTSLNNYTIYIMTMFMFIGGSPGSTAGGVKTTTLAILVQSIISTLKGDKTVKMFDRTIAAPYVVRATALTFISLMIASLFIFILMNVESEQSFLPIFFETVSSLGTVGLSLGLTPYLSVAGKIVISVLMLIGRIGPLTLILAIGERQKGSGKYQYPDGRIIIG